MAKFRCDCQTHILEVSYDKKFKCVGVLIYDIYSPKGRKYKKPKVTADVVLMNNKYPKELTNFLTFIKGIKL